MTSYRIKDTPSDLFTTDRFDTRRLKVGLTDVDIDIQHPLPTNGDSVYVKDINTDLCVTANWLDTDNSGDDLCYIPFNDLQTRITNSTTDAIKILTFSLNRSVNAHQVGLGCNGGGDFSNVKITLLGSGGVERTVRDDSLNDTKYTSRNYVFEPQLFNAVKIEFYTTDPVCISNCTIQKSTITDSSLNALSELTNQIENIKSFRGALQIDSALVHKQGVNLYFFQPNGAETTTTVETTTEDISVTVVDSTGFSIGDKIRLTGTIATGQSFIVIVDIIGNVIYLDRPLGSVLPIGTPVDIVYTNMNVLGSMIAPSIFKISPPNIGADSPVWQLTRMIISITSTTAMDDGKFGGRTSLLNGVDFRVVKGDGSIQDLTNWKNNGDIALDMYDVTYTDKAPAGEYGLRGRWTFTNAEFVVELDGAQGDYLELRVQDDLTSLSTFRIKAQGRLFGA